MSDSPLTLIVGLSLAGLLPFALVMLTSFVKMAVVLSIVRSAMGAPQVPPNMVVTGLALVLSLVVMGPVITQVAHSLQRDQAALNDGDPGQVFAALGRASVPVEDFLVRNTDLAVYERFADMSEAPVEIGKPSAWRALVPAYVISQLREAFQMGFVIFLPFLVIDMLVASVLLSLGMHMLSPTTVSLPFKLLLFALADGWTLIGEGLLGGYV